VTRPTYYAGEATVLRPGTLGGLKIERVIDREPHFNLMVYGKSGVGKTYLAGSAENVSEMRRVLYIDVEGGIMTLRKDFPNVATVRVKTWQDLQKIYDHLYAGGHGFKTVILDSLTEIQKFNMNEIMRQLVEKKPERDPDVPDLREWGKNLEQIRRFVRAFRDLPMNVIFTALEIEKQDKMMRTIRTPSLSGRMAGEVAAFLDIVLHYRADEKTNDAGVTEVIRVLQSRATASTTAKDRSGLLPPVMVDPTMDQLYNLIIRKTGGTLIQKETESKQPTEKPRVDTTVTDEDAAALLTSS
jgi:AAA domain-containing protein